MSIWCRLKGKSQLNNRGAAIVTVIVVTAFISVIATVLLYISSMNYQMKTTDYQNKVSFYKAEEALDNLKASLVKDVNEAYQIAYRDTMNNYCKIPTQDRNAYFTEAYTQALKKIWDSRSLNGSNMLDALRTQMEDEELKKRISCEPGCGYGVNAENYFVIQGVRASYTERGYTTYIRTDIALLQPEVLVTQDKSAVYTAQADAQEREKVNPGEYVVYMNWKKE